MRLCHIQHYELTFGRPIPWGAYEHLKTPEELTIIDFVNRETNRLRRTVGVDPLDISADHYHLVPAETFRRQQQLLSGTYRKNLPMKAFTDPNLTHAIHQKSSSHNLVDFGTTVLHETLHLVSQVIIEAATQKGEHVERNRRTGVRSMDGNVTSFSGLSEAIAEEQTKRSFPRLLELPILASEKDWYYSTEGKDARQKIATEQQIPEDEIYWVDKNHPEKYESFVYNTQRDILKFICNQIYTDKKRTFQSPDQVFQELFLLAEFTAMTFSTEVAMEIAFGEKGFNFIRKMDRNDRRTKLSTLEKSRIQQQNRRINFFVCGPSGCQVESIPATAPED